MVYHVIFAYASREQGLFNYVHNHLNEDQGSDVGFKFQLSIPMKVGLGVVTGFKFQLPTLCAMSMCTYTV